MLHISITQYAAHAATIVVSWQFQKRQKRHKLERACLEFVQIAFIGGAALLGKVGAPFCSYLN